ncbi:MULTISPECIES: MmpS family transport accessory protein [Mycobacterium]|uniref:MmpS family transport accessory protein n=1 Tax=Mycobacterium TaxID=1763 RepID=UPI00097E0EFC
MRVDAAGRRGVGRGRGGCACIGCTVSSAAHHTTSAGSRVSNHITLFSPKRVVLEVFGPPGTVATNHYLDVNAQRQPRWGRYNLGSSMRRLGAEALPRLGE